MDVAAIAATTLEPTRAAARLRAAPGTAAHQLAAARHGSPAEQRAAVGAQFEAILVRQLLGKTMTAMLGTGEGTAATIYGDLLADTLATQLTAGRGLGLGRVIEAQLAPRAATAPQPFRP